MKRKELIILLFVFFICVFSNELFAQCAMCKATAESNLKSGGTIGKGLNHGILYLMGIPYIIIATLFYILFRQQINEKLKVLKSKFLNFF